MSIKKVESFPIMPQDDDFKNKEITIHQLKEIYKNEYAERQARREKAEQLILQEESCYERAKMQLRNFCARLLYRD
jgi:hypothetical protein